MHINDIDEIIDEQVSGRHSYFQLEYFLIQNEPTMQAKMHQCLVELKSRKNTLENVELEIDETWDKLELLDLEEIKYNSEQEKSIKERIIGRKKKYLNKRIKELKQVQKSTMEEVEFIIKIYRSLTEKEPQQNWDSLNVQLEYYNAKLMRELRMKVLMGNPVDGEMVKTIFALPDIAPVKQEILKGIENNKKMLQKNEHIEITTKNINNNTDDTN